MIAYLITAVLLIGIVVAIRVFLKRQAAHRAAHDARLRTMTQATLAAMKKKQATQAAAPATPAAPAAAVPAREERECPFCAERILKKARVCRFCGRDVEPLA